MTVPGRVEAGHDAIVLAAPSRGLSPQGLRCVDGFELDGRDVADARVKPSLVVPADPPRDLELELIAGLPDPIGDQLGLERIDERLGQRVVIRVADGPQRGVVPCPRKAAVKSRLVYCDPWSE